MEPKEPIDLSDIRRRYREGANIIDYLRQKLGTQYNTEQCVEISYDMQAGSYIEHVEKNYAAENAYHSEIAGVLARYLSPNDAVLDVGTGEMTTLASVAQACYQDVAVAFAVDISLSRLVAGRGYLERKLAESLRGKINPAVSTLFRLPFADASVDVVWTSHALEPNGGRELEAISELARVAGKYLVLFEPSYTHNSSAGRQRMDKLGYIKDLEATVGRIAALELEDVVPIRHTGNPLNPTYAHIIRKKKGTDRAEVGLRCPLTRGPLERRNGYLFSRRSLLAYPVIENIPILRIDKGINASILDRESDRK